MKRGIVLLSLIVLGGLPLTITAIQQTQGPSAGGIEVDKLKDNLYVLKALTNGGGGNTSVFITATGVVVVDTKNPGWGQPLLEKIKTLTPKPVTMINTITNNFLMLFIYRDKLYAIFFHCYRQTHIRNHPGPVPNHKDDTLPC